MVQDTPSRKLDQYIVRFPDGMRDQLKAEAERNGRSLNAEIVTRLEASLLGGTAKGDVLEQIMVNAMEKLMEGSNPPPNRAMQRLLAEYESYVGERTHQVRRFLDLVEELMRPSQVKSEIWEERFDRVQEHEMNRIRSFANSQGYELVKRKPSKD